MSYKALYRKYRPKSFDDVKGQDHIIRTLKNIVQNRKISHAYLFSGPRGVGKTSVAKIFANIINCFHDSNNLTKLCDKCLEQINQNMDIIEMDAASNNGVDSIRELREKIEHLPVSGQYKVYIIDEVHMLSKGAFNALLKTLEEPPEHAVFILATTDPQKIPLTILSRVQRFNFRKMTNNVLMEQIRAVLKSEKIKYEDEIVGYIARLATGGMRDALSILDQAAAYGNGEIKLEDVMFSFGITSNESIINIINNLYDRKIKEVLVSFNELRASGLDAKQFVQNLSDVFKDYLIYKRTFDPKILEVLSVEELKMLKINDHFAFSSVEKIYQLNKDLFYSDNPFQLIELYLIKMIREKTKEEIELEEAAQKLEAAEKIITPNKEAQMATPDKKKAKKKDKKEDTLNTVLNQTQEIVIEANVDSVNNEIIDDDILTGSFDIPTLNEEVNTTDDGIIDTREILLDAKETIEVAKILLVPEFDKKYLKMKSFKPKFSKKQLENALILADLELLKSSTAALKFISQMVENKNYKDLIMALDKFSIKAAGQNFLVLVSEDIPAMNYLQDISNKQNVQNFIKDYFGGYKHLIIYTKPEFKTIGKNVVKMINQKPDIAFETVPFGPVDIEKEANGNKKLFNLLKDID